VIDAVEELDLEPFYSSYRSDGPEIVSDRDGSRFRVLDPDGNVIEVRTRDQSR
jgi:hypothetical protein